jgi:HSP20 family molecular chaperone IbpA
MFDMNDWYRPTLDMFDPFDDLDRMMSRNLTWLDRPRFLDYNSYGSQVPQKYRVSLDCSGYNQESIKTDVKNGKLVITGMEGSRKGKKDGGDQSDDDYSVREFKKSFKLPENVEVDKLVSFMTSNGQLVVEIPLKPSEEELKRQQQLSNSYGSTYSSAINFPQIVDGENGQKQVLVNMTLPKDIDPSKVSVTCKDRDLIVQAEEKADKQDGFYRSSFYQRTTLPENTDFTQLKCLFNNSELKISAPLMADYQQNGGRRIPIEYNQNSNNAATANNSRVKSPTTTTNNNNTRVKSATKQK